MDSFALQEQKQRNSGVQESALIDKNTDHINTIHITNSNVEDKKKYFNSLVVLNNKLEILSLYNKINLVTFGEFLPFEKTLSQFGLKKITRGYNSFSPGDKRTIINLGNKFNEKLILPLICYEIIY